MPKKAKAKAKPTPAKAAKGANGVRTPVSPTPAADELPQPTFTSLLHAEIEPAPDNPRKTFAKAEIDEMAQSIGQRGLIQPIACLRTVDEKTGAKRHIIVDGERRWRAIGALIERGILPRNWQIPVAVRPTEGDLALIDSLIANVQRADLTPLEEAEALRQLQELDPERYATGKLAALLGKDRRHVQLRLALVEKLAPEVQSALAKGTIELAHARELTSVPKAVQGDVLKEIADRIEDGDHVTAEDLHADLESDRVDLALAIFDPAEHADRIVDGTKKGQRFFIGKDRFLELQRKAAGAKAKALRKTWAWAEVSIGYFASYNYEDKTSKDRAKAGVLLSIDTYSGKVTERAGLVKRKATSSRNSNADSEQERLAREQQSAAREQLDSDLSAAVSRADPFQVLRLLLFIKILPFRSQLNLDPYSQQNPFAQDGALAAWRDHFSRVVSKDGIITRDLDQGALWSHLSDLGKGDLPKLLANIVAGQIEIDQWGTLNPAVFTIAESFGVTVPDVLLPKPKGNGKAAPAAGDAQETTMAQAFKQAKPTKGKRSKASADAPAASQSAVEPPAADAPAADVAASAAGMDPLEQMLEGATS